MINKFEYSKESKNRDWHCVVHQEPWNDKVKVYLMFIKDGTRKIAHTKNGEIILSDFREADLENEPFLILPYLGWETLLECLGGITPDQVEIETGSELRATKYHSKYFAQLFEMKQSGQLSDHGVREVLKVYLDKAKECYSLCQQVDQIKIK